MRLFDYYLTYVTAEPKRRLPDLAPWFNAEHEILEVGSGVGNLTIELARDGYRVLACEPDDLSRAVAVHRFASDPELRERVSVLPLAVDDAPLPDRLGGALLSHVLFYLDADARRDLWGRLSTRIVPGAAVLVSRAWPTASEPVERKLLGEPHRLGRFEYRRWFASEPVEGADVPTMRYTNTFEMLDGETVLASETTTDERPVLSEEAALAEVGDAFDVRLFDDGWFAAVRR